MIPRYSRPEMTAIWDPANKFRIWFEIEAHACDAQANLGVIPKDAAKAVWEKGDKPYTDERIERINEIERETHHDVIAFLTELSEHIGDESRFVHQGMTSSDVLDTCLAVQMTQAADIIIADLDTLLEVLERRAQEHKNDVCIGRSHGIHAEPTTFGVKLAGHYAEFKRNRDRMVQARAETATCAISGAIGSFANIDPQVEEYVADKLGLSPEPVSTQVIPRDRHAAYFATMGVIAGGIERLATEIRHLQRSEVREAQEYFAPGQKGSSAMPHKRNPILSENLTGLARIVRAAVVPAMENITLWHERDISHSSVERMFGPDATVTLDFALKRLTGMIDKMVVYPKAMMENLMQFGGLHDSQRVLLTLTQHGVSREDSYKIVQRNAMKVWRSYGIDPDDPNGTIKQQPEDLEAAKQESRFFYYLSGDDEVTTALGDAGLKDLFAGSSTAFHTRNVDAIFTRVFG
ncbi:MAG: adenylosuccinate lyase [Rhodospirillaceae bacterium]|jgi:adenylosuccinate lyase|nr:adenylosuccinate lyase [Rhodospirillaceae bacterium]MBT5308332.1 adenylosuccinate lyase [Rhodospirillaceae bacterium]MBT6407547.1 adenylosuccinate lyase [Rhodospirillaceae bacterium]MBT7356880.1 adenylosuccinate lyase [Rhodospirillaceae bacterium]